MEKRFNKGFGKSAQQILGLSFGVIFSILLIIFFIIIAFIVIKNFLDVQGCAKIEIFVNDLKTDVKRTWNSGYDSHSFQGLLPSKIDYVCFADFSSDNRGGNMEIWDEITLYESKNSNMFLYPTGKACEVPNHDIPHIDLEEITKDKNPYCIPVNKGKIVIKIEKGLNERFVKVG